MNKHKFIRTFLQCILAIILMASGMHVMAQTAPTATTAAATGVGPAGATVNGTVNANGSSTVVFFEYGLTDEYGITVPAAQSPVSGSTDTPVSATLFSLEASTTYHYRVGATNAGGTTYGGDMTFTTQPSSGNPPLVITDAATGIGVDSATLNGRVYTYNVSATVTFEWGLDINYGNTVTADQSPLTSGSLDPVTASLTGLANNTTYHYRVVASSIYGTRYGNDMTFAIGTGGSAPTATTNAATGVGSTTATLNGTVNANGASTVVTFEYGLDTGYGSIATAVQTPVSGSTDTAVSVTISSFLPNTTYHYRVTATNVNGTTNGADMTFTTLPLAPTATTDAASSVTASGATLNGTVNANGDSSAVTFEYGLTTAYGTTVPADQSPVTGSTGTPVSRAITGLTNGLTYHYRVAATNSGGTTYGADMTFTAGATAPTATTNAASGIGATTATLNGTVNANGDSTTVTFEYGETTSYGRTVQADQSPVTGSTNTAVSAAVSGLIPNTTYHFRVVAQNAGGTTYGADITFNAGGTPTVTTDAATGVGSSGATLNGTVNANNSSTTVTFEYGLTTAYGTTVAAAPSPVTGSVATAVSRAITGLANDTTYHYRVVGQNANGTTYGADMTFTTSTLAPPTVVTDPATFVIRDGATLNGTVDANNSSTTVTFEYGLTTAYGTTVTADQSPVTGAVNTAVSKTVTGLANNTTYHYRVVGSNAQGTGNGGDMTFTTGPNPVVITEAATGVTSVDVTLNGTVNANYNLTQVTFELGLTTSYGITIVPDQSTADGNTNTAFSHTLPRDGLFVSPNTTYHYRVVGVNGLGTFYGADMTFTTLPTSAPTAVTDPASGIGSGIATLNATVNPGGSSYLVDFEYGLTTGYGTTVNGNPYSVSGAADIAITASISGLLSNTPYHYRVVVKNSFFPYTPILYGGDMTFTTIAPPSAVTDPASAVGATTATLNGTVNSNNGSTTVTFEYGLDTNYGFVVTADQSPVSGSTNTAVSNTLDMLAPNTTYHYRVVAQKDADTVNGGDMTFTTSPLPPNAYTNIATAVSTSGATLNGIVNANNDSTTVTFEYGETISYGTTITADQSPVTGGGNTAVSSAITGLNTNTTYHYRVVAQNSSGTTYGANMTFLTGTTAPTVTTGTASSIGYTSTTFNGTVNANNASTTVTFEYGETTGYGRTVTADQSPVTGSTDTAVSFTSTDLLPNTLYHYRAVGQNASGTTYGADMTFTTNPADTPTVATANVTNITALTATGGGDVTAEGSAPVTARGVCWSTVTAPTIADNLTSDGSGPGAFASSITGLNELTTYYIRAYATNIYGTAYGQELLFTTPAGVLPTITTANVTNITALSARSGGNVTDEGDTPVTARGVCWSTAPNPTIANNRSTDGSGPGAFTSDLINLTELTTYYVRAYATNSFGTSYGSEFSFTTTAGLAPTLSTVNVTNITAVSAASGGNITDEGDAPVTARGVCWSTSPNPTIADNTTSDGTGTGSFTSNLTGLTPGTTYYIRAYATNSFGTGYGNELQFTTSTINPPTVTTANVTEISAFMAKSGGNVTSEGDAPVTARGICWSISPNPTIADKHTTNGSGPGAFTAYLTSLMENTTYYVRAYAANIYGTAYGNELQFTTTSGSAPTVTTANVTDITADSAKSGGNVTSEGGTPVTARGVCWSTSPNPTTADNTTSNGTGSGTFTSTLTGLTENTSYYIRAYATNSLGTAYGNELQFTTGSTVVSVNITEPGEGEVVSGTVTIAASASVSSADTSADSHTTASSIAKVEFYIDDTLIGTDTSSLYEIQWDSTTVADGSHTIKAAAYDQNNNTSQDQITVTVLNTPTPAELLVNRDNLNFGAIVGGGTVTRTQTLLIDKKGQGSLNWSISFTSDWLSCTPASGQGPALVNVSVNASALAAGSHSDTITVVNNSADSGAVTIPVNLTVYNPGSTSAPFGEFSTPINNSTVMSSIPVTGWVLDDIETTNVTIYRAPVPGEGSGLVYIGDAILVDGARPDVEAAYPLYPLNYQAGWGYMLLTNFLPNQGNGTFTLYARATDKEGNTVTLGSKTIFADNANAVKPFGAIDTPGQGGTASGSSYVNFGWALTPQPNTIPIDGSTIKVWVDGVPLGHPVYNQYRKDIATLFPGYNNSNGAVGYFYLDTTAYRNGVHTIAWSVKDDAGNMDGIGSRYFTIINSGASYGVNDHTAPEPDFPADDFASLPDEIDKTALNELKIKEVEHVEFQVNTDFSAVRGYLFFNGKFRPLPIGSTLDHRTGRFYWGPGPGFLGAYRLVFVIETPGDNVHTKTIDITIEPKFNE